MLKRSPRHGVNPYTFSFAKRKCVGNTRKKHLKTPKGNPNLGGASFNIQGVLNILIKPFLD